MLPVIKEMSVQAESALPQPAPRNGLEAWFLAMGQTDFARMDEDKPLVHEVKKATYTLHWITAEGFDVLHETEQSAYDTFRHYRDLARLPMSVQ